MFWLISVFSVAALADDQLLKGLHAAVNDCDLNATALLLDRGANPNTFVKAGGTHYENALTKAIARAKSKRKQKCRDQILLLLEKGKADPNVQSPFGFNAMHRLAWSVLDLELFELLVSHGGDPNLQVKTEGRNQGESFLMKVVNGASGSKVKGWTGNSRAAEKLKAELDKIVHVAKLTDLDLQDAKGKTALIYATKSNNCLVVAELVKLGADTQVKDADGQTAVDYALGNASAACLALVEK